MLAALEALFGERYRNGAGIQGEIPGQQLEYERVLGYACFFTGCSGFISVACIWPLLSELIRKLPPSLI